MLMHIIGIVTVFTPFTPAVALPTIAFGLVDSSGQQIQAREDAMFATQHPLDVRHFIAQRMKLHRADSWVADATRVSWRCHEMCVQ
jgi:hypothetical protein